MSSVYLDTHAAVFLHAGEIELLGTEGKRQIEEHDLLISPMVLLEFAYLFEKKTVRFKARDIYTVLNASFGITLCTIPAPAVADIALDLDWTRDPFDRIIVAQAIANQNATLITRDRNIRLNYRNAIW